MTLNELLYRTTIPQRQVGLESVIRTVPNVFLCVFSSINSKNKQKTSISLLTNLYFCFISHKWNHWHFIHSAALKSTHILTVLPLNYLKVNSKEISKHHIPAIYPLKRAVKRRTNRLGYIWLVCLSLHTQSLSPSSVSGLTQTRTC